MKIARRLASGVAALGLAGVGVVGLGTTSAHATDRCIRSTTDNGAQVGLCVSTYSGSAHLSWSIGLEYARTDERMNFTLSSHCYNANASVNDFQQHTGDMWVDCSGPFQGSFTSTESGKPSGGASTGWFS
ncbi:hypothetical protein [Streptomyces sp. NPDC056682]|uniref:hypothetical protein n=1 Tax=Streptomyces sp. NPDC056682 TaxID=3345909 RepID=UPI0036CE3065